MTTSDSDPNPPVVRGSVNRRDFLKKSGGASVATMLALHGTKSDVMASGTAYVGMYCQNPLPTGASTYLAYGTNTSGSGFADFLNSPAPVLWPLGKVKAGAAAGSATVAVEIKYNPLLTVPVAPGAWCNFDSTGFLNGGWVALGADKDLGMAQDSNLLLRRCDKAWFADGWCYKVRFTYDTFVNTAPGVGFTATGDTDVFVRPGDGWTSTTIIAGRAGFVPYYQFPSAQALTIYIDPSSVPKKVHFAGLVNFATNGFVQDGKIAAGYSPDLVYCYDGTNYHTAKVRNNTTTCPLPTIFMQSGTTRIGFLDRAYSAITQDVRTGPLSTDIRSVAQNTLMYFDSTTGWLI